MALLTLHSFWGLSLRCLHCVKGRPAWERVFDDKAVELGFHRGSNDRLLGQAIHGLIPRLLPDHSILDRPRQELTNFFAFQRHQLVIGVVSIELRREIQGMNARVVSFDDDVVPLAEENVVFSSRFCDLSWPWQFAAFQAMGRLSSTLLRQ